MAKDIIRIVEMVKENAKAKINDGISSRLLKYCEVRGGKLLNWKMEHINNGEHTSSFMGTDLIELANRYANIDRNIAFVLTNIEDFTDIQLYSLYMLGIKAFEMKEIQANIKEGRN